MDTIEVADGDGTVFGLRGNLLQRSEGPHGAQSDSLTLMRRPSYASRTLSGSVLSVYSCGRSWLRCVKNARFGCSFSTSLTASLRVVWVGWGLCLRASRKRTSSPSRRAIEAGGISL